MTQVEQTYWSQAKMKFYKTNWAKVQNSFVAEGNTSESLKVISTVNMSLWKLKIVSRLAVIGRIVGSR